MALMQELHHHLCRATIYDDICSTILGSIALHAEGCEQGYTQAAAAEPAGRVWRAAEHAACAFITMLEMADTAIGSKAAIGSESSAWM